MCLYPILIPNPKYRANKKNKGSPPEPKKEFAKVPVGCGVCEECMRQRANEWRVRLYEEIRDDKSAIFVTLTFDENHLEIESNRAEKPDDPNSVAATAVRHFTERWRKKHKKALKHWLITELGHTGTERLHLHGIIFKANKDEIEKAWGNGWIYFGEYVNERTINYVIKYCTKQDKDHPNFKGKVFASKGIGYGYISRKENSIVVNQFKGEETRDYYIDRQGHKRRLPNYYRNKLYTDEQREQLWLSKQKKQEIFVMGQKYSLKTLADAIKYEDALRDAREKSVKHGFIGRYKYEEQKYMEMLKRINKF